MLRLLKKDARAVAVRKAAATVHCTSCSVRVRSVFFRCLDCSRCNCNCAQGRESRNTAVEACSCGYVDLCRRCFPLCASSLHASHAFVRSDTSLEVEGVLWSFVSAPHTLAPHMLRELAYGELSPRDLDISASETLTEQLVAWLPQLYTADGSVVECVMCGERRQGNCRVLACSHNVHHTCLKESLREHILEHPQVRHFDEMWLLGSYLICYCVGHRELNLSLLFGKFVSNATSARLWPSANTEL
jgi:hypothetical protein